MSDEMRITGGYWAHQPRGLLDVLRCVAGFHRSAMRGTDGTEVVDRCKCGAMRLDGYGPWGLAEHRLRFVSRKRSARLVAQDRETERQIAAMREWLPQGP